MSALAFISSGAAGDSFEEWDYDRCNEDEVRLGGRESSFEVQQGLAQLPLHQRVAWTEHGHLKFSKVDNLVQVTEFAEPYKQEGVAFWKGKQFEAIAFTGLSALTTVAIVAITREQ